LAAPRRVPAVADAEEGAPRSRRARELIAYLQCDADPVYARLETFDAAGHFDRIDLVVEPQLPQDRAVPIENEEPIRITFDPDDEITPSVYSRRPDFPLDLVHTNYEGGADGRCLCIWEENWGDLRRGLTAQALVERIRDWFARTARGELHQAGQPLEPLIPADAHSLVLPPGEPPATCYVQRCTDSCGRFTVVLGASASGGAHGAPLSLFQLTVAPQVHGALRDRPTTMAALQAILEPMGENPAKALDDWIVSPEHMKADDRLVLILVTIPKKRDADSDPESWDIWAFTPTAKLHELGDLLGRTMKAPGGGRGVLMGGGDPPDLAAIRLDGWRVVQRLDRRAARLYSGNQAKEDAKLVGIGAGAIGSNVMINAARSGIGTWTVIDDDIVLPHNTVRQAQTDHMVGWPKAETAAAMLDGVLAEGGSSHIVANLLRRGDEAKAMEDALAAADLVVDFSASPAVLGRIADEKQVKRAASFFFNPSGDDLVILAEDTKRTLCLDEIEAQYFLAAAEQPLFAGHLGDARIDLVRYANACRDLTRPLPPWQVQTLSGIAAGGLVSLLAEAEASARLWRLSPVTGSIIPVLLELAETRRHEFGGFRVTVSEEVLKTMCALRRAAMPNETGGVLLGSFDLSRAILHIVAALPAPPDSRQAPTYFIRGAKELRPRVDGINLRSAGMINYVGEWHSHPKGAKAQPSGDDEEVFAHLRNHLHPTGAPYVMAICGERETWLRASWQGWETAEGVMAHDRH